MLSFSVSKGSRSHIIWFLTYLKVCAIWAPLSLTVEYKTERKSISSEFITNVQAEEEAICSRIVNSIWNLVPSFWTGGKKKICGKAHSSTPWKKSLEKSPSAGKVMITIFWSCDWVHLVDAVLREEKVNSDTYIRTLTDLRRRFIRVWPHKNMAENLFWLAVQGCTRVGRLRNHLQNLVAIVTLSTLWHTQISTNIEPWRMQFTIQSLRHDVVIHPELATWPRQGMVLTMLTHTFSSLAQGCRSGCGDTVEK